MASSRVECKHPNCKSSFASHDSMTQHFSATHTSSEAQEGKRKYACKLCDASFTTQEALQGHMHSLHFPLACNDCGKANFRTADALHQHQWDSVNHTRVSKRPMNLTHGTHVRTCSRCDTEFPTAEDLELHFAEQHPVWEVPKSGVEDYTWQQLEACFRSTWKKPTITLNKVHRIFKIYISGWRRAEFEQYRKEIKTVVSNQNFIKKEDLELYNKILHDGNELLRYHGTSMTCKLGQPLGLNCNNIEDLSLCSDKDCNFCQILQIGLKKSKCRLGKFQRFGKGIYCSATSSKASAYVKCRKSTQKVNNILKLFYSCFGNDASAHLKENYKMMMVCRVIAGRPYHSTYNLEELMKPPLGFHSVQGDPGKNLNYDELVVYEDRAILTAYIIQYTSSD